MLVTRAFPCCLASLCVDKKVQIPDPVTTASYSVGEAYEDVTSMMQVSLQLGIPGDKAQLGFPGDKLDDVRIEFSRRTVKLPQPLAVGVPSSGQMYDRDGAPSRMLVRSDFPVTQTNETQCLPFETRTAANGLPVCVEALLFGFLSASSIPIGALLGACLAPVSRGTTARWLALGSGALVFSVATQIYGNALFTLQAISRKYGPLDSGCIKVHSVSVCDEKFINMIVQMVAGLIGAGTYVLLNRWLEQWSSYPKSACRTCAPDLELTKNQSEMPSETALDLPAGNDGHSNVALSIWLGMLLDSIPEAIMLGLMTNRHQLSFGFIFAIFLANFPEAFSGTSMLLEQRMSVLSSFLLWSSIFVVTGVLAMAASFAMPEHCSGGIFSTAALYGTAFAQGLTGGMMLAMMATAMLPEAYQGARNSAGMYFVFGFAISVGVQTLDSYLAGPQQLLHYPYAVIPTYTRVD